MVLIKQVPDTTEVKIDPKTGNLLREGVPSIINPDDTCALEAAVALKEKHGGRVTVLTMGPPQAVEALAEALGMGADEAILLSDRAFAGADTWATSTTLGKAVEKAGRFDLVLCGRQAIDGDTAQIGPQVAEFLGFPQITYVRSLKVTGNKVIAERILETGIQKVECPMPALATLMKGGERPRYPTIPALLFACSERAPIRVWNAADLGMKVTETGLRGSLTQVIRTFTPEHKRKGILLSGTAKEVSSELVQNLKGQHLI
jgi:electron transfer flavoprotein beta subunit